MKWGMKNKFILGLVTALVLGAAVNIIWGYIKFGYFQSPKKILGNLTGNFGKIVFEYKKGRIEKEVKECKDLVLGASSFGGLKVTILENGKPIENLEIDLNTKPGPNRCMQKTDKDGVSLFTNVPTGKMVIYFNQADFPKEFGQSPSEPVEIIQGQVIEKIIVLKKQ